jgi:hypothetical protein
MEIQEMFSASFLNIDFYTNVWEPEIKMPFLAEINH